MNSKLSTLDLRAHEVELHYTRPLYPSMLVIKNSRDAQAAIRLFANSKQLDLKESFWVMCLTSANRVISISEVASGSTRGVQMNTKLILQIALLTNASAIIVGHNHPSGNLNKSRQDKCLTQKLKEASEILEVTLLDHLIITTESYASFSDDCEL